jgi:hypothetical protein
VSDAVASKLTSTLPAPMAAMPSSAAWMLAAIVAAVAL